MFTLIDVSFIIKKHYDTLLRDAKLRFIIFLFIVIPLVASIFFIKNDKLLTQDSVNALITAFAIFTGLLLNVIFILFDIVGKVKGNTTHANNRRLLLEHLYANTLYALLVSAITLIFLIITTITEIWQNNSILLILSSIVYFGGAHFMMTLLMIFNRLSILLFSQLERED